VADRLFDGSVCQRAEADWIGPSLDGRLELLRPQQAADDFGARGSAGAQLTRATGFGRPSIASSARSISSSASAMSSSVPAR